MPKERLKELALRLRTRADIQENKLSLQIHNSIRYKGVDVLLHNLLHDMRVVTQCLRRLIVDLYCYVEVWWWHLRTPCTYPFPGCLEVTYQGNSEHGRRNCRAGFVRRHLVERRRKIDRIVLLLEPLGAHCMLHMG